MNKRNKAPASRHEPSAQRSAPRRVAWRTCITVAVGAAVAGTLLWEASQPGPWRLTPPRETKLRTSDMGVVESVGEAEQERALRTEQLRAAEKLMAEFPGNDDVVYLAGLVRNEQGDSDTAMKLWTRSLELDATRADANESLGYALLLRDEYEQAEAYLRKALVLDAALLSARFRLAVALSHQGKMREVISVLEDAGSLSAEAHRLLGEAYQNLKNYEKAKASYEAAIRLKPDLAEAYYGLSKTFMQEGDRDKGSHYLEKFTALKKANDDEGRRWRANFSSLSVAKKSVAQTHTDVGRVYVIQGRAREAEELWLKAAVLDPSNTLCRLQLAVHYQRSNKAREALRFYEEVARIDPADALVHLNIGRLSLNLNQMERAEPAFKEVIKLVPNRPEGHSALAQLYLQLNRDPAEAVRLADVAVKLAPEAIHFAILGQARARNGDRAGALTAINRAIELQPGNGQFVQLREQLLERK